MFKCVEFDICIWYVYTYICTYFKHPYIYVYTRPGNKSFSHGDSTIGTSLIEENKCETPPVRLVCIYMTMIEEINMRPIYYL
jgi:hypothetical protein